METTIHKLSRMGWGILGVGMGLLVSWVVLASLESAAIAFGVLEPAAGVHHVEHLDGGIVKKVC